MPYRVNPAAGYPYSHEMANNNMPISTNSRKRPEACRHTADTGRCLCMGRLRLRRREQMALRLHTFRHARRVWFSERWFLLRHGIAGYEANCLHFSRREGQVPTWDP